MWNSKWDTWYDSLPKHTKEWLKNQPVWHDRAMSKAFIFGILVGILIGVIV